MRRGCCTIKVNPLQFSCTGSYVCSAKKKNLRCFPSCSINGHNDFGFCGREVKATILACIGDRPLSDLLPFAIFRTSESVENCPPIGSSFTAKEIQERLEQEQGREREGGSPLRYRNSWVRGTQITTDPNFDVKSGITSWAFNHEPTRWRLTSWKGSRLYPSPAYTLQTFALLKNDTTEQSLYTCVSTACSPMFSVIGRVQAGKGTKRKYPPALGGCLPAPSPSNKHPATHQLKDLIDKKIKMLKQQEHHLKEESSKRIRTSVSGQKMPGMQFLCASAGIRRKVYHQLDPDMQLMQKQLQQQTQPATPIQPPPPMPTPKLPHQPSQHPHPPPLSELSQCLMPQTTALLTLANLAYGESEQLDQDIERTKEKIQTQQVLIVKQQQTQMQ